MDDQINFEAAKLLALHSKLFAIFTLADLKAMMEKRAQAGWVWNEVTHTLAHPDDPHRYFHIDPDTHQLSVSPTLASQLTEGYVRPGSEPQA